MMHRGHFLIPTLLLFVFWILLSGRNSIFFVSLGLSSAVLSYAIYFRYFSHFDFSAIFSLHFLKYLSWLVLQIILSSASLLRLVYSRKLPILNDNETFVSFSDLFADDVSNTLFACSVTLTPGTVTVSISENRIYFHCFDNSFKAGIPDIKNHISGYIYQ